MSFQNVAAIFGRRHLPNHKAMVQTNRGFVRYFNPFGITKYFFDWKLQNNPIFHTALVGRFSVITSILHITMRYIILGITLTLLNLILSRPSLAETKIHISDLNKGDVELVGELGPLEKDYLIVAEFAMFTPHGRAGLGGDLRMKVIEVDGKKLAKPLWLRYFKTVSLEEYTLPDGTDIFAQNPYTHTLQGKTVTCTVSQDIVFLDQGGAVNVLVGEDLFTNKGFEKPWYETILGIVKMNPDAEEQATYKQTQTPKVLASKSINVSDLNSGQFQLIGQFGPLGTFHQIEGEFKMGPEAVRYRQQKYIGLKVLMANGTKLADPIWLNYFKGITLQDYNLPDGTDIFPDYKHTEPVLGKTMTCIVYEDINLRSGADHKIEFQTMLGILKIPTKSGSAVTPK